MRPGARIGGDLRLVRALERGPAVWEALRGDGRRVVVRFAPEEAATNPQVRARFAKQTTLAMSLEDAHVAESSGYGVAKNGVPYVVMEHLDGETFATILERDGRLPPKRALRLLEQVASALGEAHHKGLVHGTLSPATIFMAPASAKGEPPVRQSRRLWRRRRRQDAPRHARLREPRAACPSERRS